MKKIGLVGGTGPESTLMYYKELNARIDEMTENKAMPDIAIESVNFRKAWNMVVAEDYEALAEYLSEKINALKKSGSEVIALTAVTMHIVFDLVQEKTGVSLISIPRAVCNEVKRRNYKKIGLLGTIFTMEQDYMKKDFEQAGIEVIVPNEEDRKLVAKRIFEELEVGIVKENTLNEFNEIIANMKMEHGIEAVVLGCTELPLLLNDENCVLPCLDSVEIHIKELIDLAEVEEYKNGDLHEEIVESERLVMRRLRPEDYKAMAAWDMDERVYKYLMSPACKSPEEPLVWLPKKDPKSRVNILMLVTEKSDGHAVGIYALNYVADRDVWTLSYVNRYDDWGKGYTVEGMKALMNHAVRVYGARSFEGECAKDNVGSARVMQKLGMVFDHVSSYSKSDGSATFESEIYRITVDENGL